MKSDELRELMIVITMVIINLMFFFRMWMLHGLAFSLSLVGGVTFAIALVAFAISKGSRSNY